MHSALTSVQVLFTYTREHNHWFWGLLIMTAKKGIALQISYSDDRLLVTFFLGFYIVTTGKCFYFCPWGKTEKTPQHSETVTDYGATPLVQIRKPRISMLFLLNVWYIFTRNIDLIFIWKNAQGLYCFYLYCLFDSSAMQ
jgi:hypothetical protein